MSAILILCLHLVSATRWNQGFKHLPEVPQSIPTNTTELILSHNNITKLKRNGFAQLTMLEGLWLHVNSIREIEEGAFKGLEKLELLDLDSNCLEELRPGMFSGLHSLKSINLRFNKLSSIDNETFVGLPRPLEINLWGNDLKCNDGLRRFQNEMDDGTINTLRKVQKIRVILGKSENTFRLLQWMSMRNRYF